MNQTDKKKLALVMSGGGARAAYQIGVLKHLAKYKPELATPIITGVSAGAINAGYFANHQGPFVRTVNNIIDVWQSVTIDQVFEVGSSLTRNVFRWGGRLFMGGESNVQVQGMVNTEPLRAFLHKNYPSINQNLIGIDNNVRKNKLEAFAITAINYTTGQTSIWVQGSKAKTWNRPSHVCVETEVEVEHIMASSALPLFFPAIRIGNAWFGDGGIGETAPLAPAIRLGADKILAISTRFKPAPEQEDDPVIDGYPPPAQVVGILMNNIFVDALDRDANQLRRINKLLKRMNKPESDGLKKIDLLVLRPSQDISYLAGKYAASLSGAFSYFSKGIGFDETKRPDWLSMILFESPYVEHLIAVGEEDAKAREEELLAFLED